MIIRLINILEQKSIEFWDAREQSIFGNGEPDPKKMQFKLLEGFNGIYNLPSNILYDVYDLQLTFLLLVLLIFAFYISSFCVSNL